MLYMMCGFCFLQQIAENIRSSEGAGWDDSILNSVASPWCDLG